MSAIDAIRLHVIAAENTYNELKRILADAEAVAATVTAAQEKVNAAEEKAAAAKQEALAARAAEATALETAAAAAAAAAELSSPAVGTKFKWVSETNPDTYRIAVVTNKGFLQVKSVTENAVESDTTRTIGGNHPLIRKLFTDEAAWRASLPGGGTTDVSFSQKIAEAQRTDETFNSLSDVEKVGALLKRYKIRNHVIRTLSPQERLAATVAQLDYFRKRINTLSYDQMIEQGIFKSTRRGIHRLLNVYSWQRKCVAEAGANANTPRFYYSPTGTGAIYATINGQPRVITIFEGKIAASEFSRYYSEVKFYNDFAEMGNPAMSVCYRKRIISI